MCSKISIISKSFVMIKVVLSLATAIIALMLISRDVGVTCRYHLSNIVPYSIFCDSMGWGTTFPFFDKSDSHCLPQHKKDGFSCLIIITLMALGKP